MLTRSGTTSSTAVRARKRVKTGRLDYHIIDEALACTVALSAGAPTSAERRQRRKTLRAKHGSKGRVSVLEQLGDLLSGLSPLEIEVYRSPQVTWRLIQKVVRRGTPRATIIRALREAVAVPPIDGRRRRSKRQRAVVTGTHAVVNDASMFDFERARADPSSYLAAALETWLRQIAYPLRALITEELADQTRCVGINDVGQSLSMLLSALSRHKAQDRPQIAVTPEQDLALRMVKRLDEIHRMLAIAVVPEKRV